MYSVTVALNKIGEYPTFKEAFTIFYHEIKKMVKEGCSWQVLETGCWIETDFGVKVFREACDYAQEIGLLSADGKLLVE